MRILIYSQQGELGGSTRLILNLARALSREHEVVLSLGSHRTPRVSGMLVAEFPELTVVPGQGGTVWSEEFDVALLHQPFFAEAPDRTKADRRLAVIMELASRHTITLQEADSSYYDRIIYLHPEQVSQLSESTIRSRGVLLPIINNIDFEPGFVQTRCVGSIGGSHKTGLQDVIRVLSALPADFTARMWSPDKLSLEELPMPSVAAALKLLGSGRLAQLAPETRVQKIQQSYDALLHAPPQGNGTSVVISDALQCVKIVVLSPLPEYRKAYGHFRGVVFLDQPLKNIARRLCGYSHAEWETIARDYAASYDREAVIERWVRVITGV